MLSQPQVPLLHAGRRPRPHSGQLVTQSPQWFGSVWVLTQTPPHSVVGLTQPQVPPIPPMQRLPPVHSASEQQLCWGTQKGWQNFWLVPQEHVRPAAGLSSEAQRQMGGTLKLSQYALSGQQPSAPQGGRPCDVHTHWLPAQCWSGGQHMPKLVIQQTGRLSAQVQVSLTQVVPAGQQRPLQGGWLLELQTHWLPEQCWPRGQQMVLQHQPLSQQSPLQQTPPGQQTLLQHAPRQQVPSQHVPLQH
jgi:hypothetical protein